MSEDVSAELKKRVGRLALRHEGSMWNAYYALPDTMEGAILLGSLAMRFAENPAQKQAFMDLMRAAVSDLMFELFGQRPTWKEPQMAAESERAGHG